MFTPIERKAIIQQRLQEAFAPIILEIIDESHKHVGHVGSKSGASHFFVSITASKFAGFSLIQQHRLIYDVLKDLIPHEIHALKINAKAP